ncbi:MAG: aminotransferase class I/II-fold pyridoxal phosphate-dependent enzyme, partial [Chitinophagaceae bacterium]
LGQVNDMIKEIVAMREELAKVFQRLPLVEKVYPSDANFLLVKVKDAVDIYEYLLNQGIVVRDRSKVQLCDQCLRITIGTEQENTLLVDALVDYMKQKK